MADSDRGATLLPLSGLVLLLAAIGGLAWLDVPLRSQRPEQPQPFDQGTFDEEDVPARLWQDPFGAVYEHYRPGERESATHRLHRIDGVAEQIRARATRQLRENATTGTSTSDSAKAKDGQRTVRVLLLPVMVPGGSYAEDEETRRRTRQAIVSALAVKGYVPELGDRVGFADTRWCRNGHLITDPANHPEGEDCGGQSQVALPLPFEWFRRDSLRHDSMQGDAEAVLVMWLDEGAFGEHLFSKLNSLLSVLLKGIWPSGPDENKRDTASVAPPSNDGSSEKDQPVRNGLAGTVRLRLIGPASSTSLIQLLDRDQPTAGSLPPAGNGEVVVDARDVSLSASTPDSQNEAKDMVSSLDVEIYSCRATAPEALLLRKTAAGDTNAPTNAESIESVMRHRHHAKFISTIPCDDALANALVEELSRRGVNLIDGKTHVALISEWDTFYGRAIPLAMESAIQYRRGRDSSGWSPSDALDLLLDGRIHAPHWVHRFSYLRGLDGSISGRENSNGASNRDKPSTPTTPWETNVEDWEKPVGPSNLDYIRRVAEKLTQLETRIADRAERLGAIGVVGSDVYDKQLVLQALRRRFPNAIFFTTDLDARLFHPNQYQWTRNLIIASGFGLELSPELQRHVPPFRDCYQTSTFLGCLLALGPTHAVDSDSRQANTAPPRASIPEAPASPRNDAGPYDITASLHETGVLASYLKPRLYEIGRSGAYDITPFDSSTIIHPDASRRRPSFVVLAKLLLVFALVTLLVIPLIQAIRQFFFARSELRPKDREWLNLYTVCAVLAVAVFVLLVFIDNLRGTGEPFELLEGISAWPTEFCRLLVVLTSCAFFLLSISRIERSNALIEKENVLPLSDAVIASAGFWTRWQKRRRQSLKVMAGGQHAQHAFFYRLGTRCYVEFRAWWGVRKKISLNVWADQRRKRIRQLPSESSAATDVGQIWKRYRQLGLVGNRLWRFVPIAVVYVLFGWSLSFLLGMYTAPTRGSLSGAVDSALLLLSRMSLVALTFFVVDATRLCEQFIRALADKRSAWPTTPFVEKIAKDRGMQLDQLPDFIDIQVIARRTEIIGRLITYPFFVLFIVLLSGIGYFDNWYWSLQVILVLSAIFVYALICAVVLRRAAETARRKAVDRLRQMESQAFVAPAKNRRSSSAHAEQLKLLIQEIQSLRRGAFTPWSQHPIIRAVLIPFGGVGAVILLDMLASVGF